MHQKQKKWKLILAGLMAGVLIGGTVAVTTPSVAAGPAKIWKQIKKKTDKRYYTKTKSNKRYAKKPTLIKGTFAYGTEANSAGDVAVSSISFGVTLPGAPVAHYVKQGDPVPADCAGGTHLSPRAAPGHLCVFEGLAGNASGTRGLTSTNGSGSDVSQRFGSVPFAYSAAAGTMTIIGAWALGTGPDATWKMVAPKSKPSVKIGR